MAVKKLSVFAERMMPDFVHREHEQFTKFIRYYFEFLEQTDGVYDYAANSLEYMDIDYTKNSMLEEFRNTYLINFPEETDVDLRFLVKHIREFYQSKGSEESYKFLFRLLYGDDDIDIYYPKLNILRSSDGKWVEDAGYDLGGYWQNTDGFLSSDMKLQDNYYYQDFSYEIITDVTRFYYENVIKQNVHVTGQKMFGRNILESAVPMSVESLDYDAYASKVGVDLSLGLLWGGTPYTVDQTQLNQQSLLIDVNGLHVQETVEFPFVSIAGSYGVGDLITVRRLGHAIAPNITFTGTGAQTDFDTVIAYTASQMLVFYDGLKMREGIDFTIASNIITFAVAPADTKKIYVLLHELNSTELISGVGSDKHIVLTDAPQGYLLNKILIFFNGVLTMPDWYDPLTNRVYFTDYVANGTDNIEIIHLDQLGYPETIQLDAPTIYNLGANKNEFLHLPQSPYVVTINPPESLGVGIAGSLLTLNVFVTPEDYPTMSLVERATILLRWVPTTFPIFTSFVDGGTGFDYAEANPDTIDTSRGEINIIADDIYFDNLTSEIRSVTTDFSNFVIDDTITVTTEYGINDGTYTVTGSTATTITVAESVLTASSGVVGNVNIYRAGLFSVVRPSDWLTVSGSGSNDGTYLVESADQNQVRIAYNYDLADELNDTAGQITISREQLQEKIYTQVGEVLLVKLIWDVTDDVLVKATEGAVSISSAGTASDNVKPKITEGAVSISSVGTASDNVKPKATEGTTVVVQTTEETDISFTATSTISTVAGDFTVFDDGDTITVATTSTTNDGTYTISGAPTATTITITEVTLTTEDAATAGTVSISRTV